MKVVAGQALMDHHNQYPPLMGLPELRQAIARHSEREQGIPVDWATGGAAEERGGRGSGKLSLQRVRPADLATLIFWDGVARGRMKVGWGNILAMVNLLPGGPIHLFSLVRSSLLHPPCPPPPPA